MRCATSSLPLPLSPVTSTLASEGAMRSTSCRSSRMGRLSPISCVWAWSFVAEHMALPATPRGSDRGFAEELLERAPAAIVHLDEAHPEPHRPGFRAGPLP